MVERDSRGKRRNRRQGKWTVETGSYVGRRYDKIRCRVEKWKEEVRGQASLEGIGGLETRYWRRLERAAEKGGEKKKGLG